MKISRKEEKRSVGHKEKGTFSLQFGSAIGVSESPESEGSFISKLVGSSKTAESKEVAENKSFHGLLSELESFSARLTQYSRLEDFYLYRKLVKVILQKALPKMFSLEKISDRPSFKKPVAKEHRVIHLVNQELNSLFQLIQEGHKCNLDITSKVLKIQGLLVDLFI